MFTLKSDYIQIVVARCVYRNCVALLSEHLLFAGFNYFFLGFF